MSNKDFFSFKDVALSVSKNPLKGLKDFLYVWFVAVHFYCALLIMPAYHRSYISPQRAIRGESAWRGSCWFGPKHRVQAGKVFYSLPLSHCCYCHKGRLSSCAFLAYVPQYDP